MEISKLNHLAVSNERIVSAEFVLLMNSMLELESSESYDIPTYLNALPFLWLYKPNRTNNLLFDSLHEGVNVYQWRDNRIVQVKPNRLKPDDIPLQWTNIVGSMLVKTTVPRFLDLESSALELYFQHQFYQSIYLRRVNEESITLDELDTVSPYSGNRAFRQGKKVCVDGEPESAEPICLYL
jgi:hypothetical protein